MKKLTTGMKLQSTKTNKIYTVNSIDENINRCKLTNLDNNEVDTHILDKVIKYIESGYYTVIEESIDEKSTKKINLNSNGLTELEEQFLNEIAKEDGNGEYITDSKEQYLSILNISIDPKILRGVISSLIKKEYIQAEYEDNETLIKITDKAIEYYNLR